MSGVADPSYRCRLQPIPAPLEGGVGVGFSFFSGPLSQRRTASEPTNGPTLRRHIWANYRTGGRGWPPRDGRTRVGCRLAHGLGP